VDAYLGTDPGNAEHLVRNPEHLGLDKALYGITTVKVSVTKLLTVNCPKASNKLAIGKVLLGVGLEIQYLKLEGVGILLLLGKLDTRVVVLAKNFARKLLLEKSLGVLECVVDSKLVDAFNHIAKGRDTLVFVLTLKRDIEGLLEGVLLGAADAEGGAHLGAL